MQAKTLSITIGIPTCYGGESLIPAIKSIIDTSKLDFTLAVVSDSVPFSKNELHILKSMNVLVTQNSHPSSQIAKVGQLALSCNSDIFIFTQDDIRFDESTVQEIISAFKKDPKLTMVAAHIMPESPHNLISLALARGAAITNTIGQMWNQGDNYLSANGRCLAFRTSHFKKFRFPSYIVGTDAFFFFENRRLGGAYTVAKSAFVYDKLPTRLREHINQTSRFQFSEEELQPLFDFSLKNEYIYPPLLAARAITLEFLKSPLYVILYLGIFVISKLKKNNRNVARNPFWSADTSTKRSN